MDYIITWMEAAEHHSAERDSANDAFSLAKRLIDTGNRAVEIRVPKSNSVVRGQAVLDIYDEINGVPPLSKWEA